MAVHTLVKYPSLNIVYVSRSYIVPPLYCDPTWSGATDPVFIITTHECFPGYESLSLSLSDMG